MLKIVVTSIATKMALRKSDCTHNTECIFVPYLILDHSWFFQMKIKLSLTHYL